MKKETGENEIYFQRQGHRPDKSLFYWVQKILFWRKIKKKKHWKRFAVPKKKDFVIK